MAGPLFEKEPYAFFRTTFGVIKEMEHDETKSTEVFCSLILIHRAERLVIHKYFTNHERSS